MVDDLAKTENVFLFQQTKANCAEDVSLTLEHLYMFINIATIIDCRIRQLQHVVFVQVPVAAVHGNHWSSDKQVRLKVALFLEPHGLNVIKPAVESN